MGFKGGAVLHASERTEDMYASIDIVSHKLAQSMKVYPAMQLAVISNNISWNTILRSIMKNFVARDSKRKCF